MLTCGAKVVLTGDASVLAACGSKVTTEFAQVFAGNAAAVVCDAIATQPTALSVRLKGKAGDSSSFAIGAAEVPVTPAHPAPRNELGGVEGALPSPVLCTSTFPRANHDDLASHTRRSEHG